MFEQDGADEAEDDVKDEFILERAASPLTKSGTSSGVTAVAESQIAFANDQFYKTLITSPWRTRVVFDRPDPRRRSLRGQAEPAEAQRICEEAIVLMERLADAPKDEFGTIGVVAINSN